MPSYCSSLHCSFFQPRDSTKDVTFFIDETVQRIQSVAILYDHLHKGANTDIVYSTDYLQEILTNLADGMNISGKGIEFDSKIDPVSLRPEKAILLGIIINELVTNAVKYAFEVEEHKKIICRAEDRSDFLLLTIRDNGKGIPESVLEESSDSFGLMLVKNLAEQLKSEMKIEHTQGTSFQFKIPMEEIRKKH
jgi:two-component sensor histidine kinase